MVTCTAIIEIHYTKSIQIELAMAMFAKGTKIIFGDNNIH